MAILLKRINIGKLLGINLMVVAGILLIGMGAAYAKVANINCGGIDDLPAIEAAVNDATIHKINLYGTCNLKTRYIPARDDYSSEIAIRRSNLQIDGGGTAVITTEGQGGQVVFFVKPGTDNPDPDNPLDDTGNIQTRNVLITGITFLNGNGLSRDHATGASSNGAKVQAKFANNVYDGQIFPDAAFQFGNVSLTIVNNLFKNQGFYSIIIESNVFNENIGDTIIKDNTFMDVSSSAIEVYGKSKAIITGNTMMRTGDANLGSVLIGGGGNVQIAKNTFSESNDDGPDVVLTGLSEFFTAPPDRRDYCDFSGVRVIDNQHSSTLVPAVVVDGALNPAPIQLLVFNCHELDPPIDVTSSGNIVVVDEDVQVLDYGQDNIVVKHK